MDDTSEFICDWHILMALLNDTIQYSAAYVHHYAIPWKYTTWLQGKREYINSEPLLCAYVRHHDDCINIKWKRHRSVLAFLNF